MGPYNGFSGQQRERAQRWLRERWTAGMLERPKICCACGQTRGRIDAHAEDYSEPFAAGKTDEFHLCYTCHMMVHCRFKNRDAWVRYLTAIRGGGHFAAIPGSSFGTFTGLFLDGPAGWAEAIRGFTPGPAPTRLVLEEISKSTRFALPGKPTLQF